MVPEMNSIGVVSVHAEVTNPQPVGTASPSRSMFQVDTVALRMKLPVT
jgi:hypothetical protein